LPDAGFTYGIPPFKGEEGAYALYSSWHCHTSSGSALAGAKNYCQINKKGAIDGMTNNKQFRAHREKLFETVNPYSNTPAPGTKTNFMRKGNSVTTLPDIYYGKPTRPQTPLKGIMVNTYGNHAAVKILGKYE